MSLGGWIVAIIIGAIVGWLVGKGRHCPEGRGWVSVTAGAVGGILGSILLGSWGWMLGGGNFFGGIIGALVIAFIVLLFLRG